MFRFIGSMLLGLALIAPSWALEIVIPRTYHYDIRDQFQIDLLKFVLDKTGTDHNLQVTTKGYSQSRIVESLKNNKLSLYWMGTSTELEQSLHAIRYPLYRGLSGYRVFIIDKHSQPTFNRVTSVDDLKKLTGVQGLGWSDIQIMEHAGLSQITGQYENIFQMINLGRGDYFSRSVFEAFLERDARQSELKNLAVEDRVLLVYPFAMFFFTNKENKPLYEAIEQGFQLAYQDGSMMEFFYNHRDIKSALAQAKIANRLRLDIPNVDLTEGIRSIPKSYWHK